MAITGILIFLDLKTYGSTYDYYAVDIHQGYVNGGTKRFPPIHLHYANGNPALVEAFLPDGDLMLGWTGEKFNTISRVWSLRVDPAGKKPIRPIAPYVGQKYPPSNGHFIPTWSSDRAYAVFVTDFEGHSGFWGMWPFLFDLRRNTLTPLSRALGGFFWHPRSQEPQYRSLICQTLYGLRRDEKGNLIRDLAGNELWDRLYDRVAGPPLVSRYQRLRITDQGKPLPPEPLSAQAVDRMIGSTYRIMTQQPRGEWTTASSSILLSPNGRTSVEYGLLNRYQDPKDIPLTDDPSQGFHLPDPLTDKDRWVYRIFHDGRFLRTVSVPPDKYIYPLQWTADSRYLIGQRGYNDGIYNPDDTVVLIEPLSWQVKPLYQPPGKWQLVAFHERTVAVR